MFLQREVGSLKKSPKHPYIIFKGSLTIRWSNLAGLGWPGLARAYQLKKTIASLFSIMFELEIFIMSPIMRDKQTFRTVSRLKILIFRSDFRSTDKINDKLNLGSK